MCVRVYAFLFAGTYFALFWVFFNVGGVVGGIITFATNYESADSTASGSTFLAFMAIMVVGTVLTLFLLPPGMVKRSDGTAINMTKHKDTTQELRAMAKLFKDKGMLRLIPMFLYSNWFLGYTRLSNSSIAPVLFENGLQAESGFEMCFDIGS